jgi:hypothetical protein
MRRGILWNIVLDVGLQTPPDESSLPEPTLEQAAAASKLQAAMEGVREKFTTQLCSLDLQLLELARAQVKAEKKRIICEVGDG